MARRERTIIQEVRNYVKEHKAGVTFKEVRDYILVEKGIDTKEPTIYNTLYRVLKKEGVKLKKARREGTITQEVRDYVEGHKEGVTFEEVRDYIIVEKSRDTKELAVSTALYRVLKEQGIKLKKPEETIAQEVRNYVKLHKKGVTFKEVRDYIIVEKGIDAKESTVSTALYRVLKEEGVKPKKARREGTITQEVRDYVEGHKEGVTFEEVRDYIIVEKGIDAKETTIRTSLSRVLKEDSKNCNK